MVLNMVKWWVHNKWAKKFGIKLADEDLDWINDIVDFPKKHVSGWFIEDYVGHDWGRRKKWEKQLQESIASERYGYDGVLAVNLHHMLDILEIFLNPDKREQMSSFEKAAKESAGTLGTVRRLDGSPSRNPNERIMPSSARAIQGLLGKCYYCKQPLAGKPFIELGNINGKNICIHKDCLSMFTQQKANHPIMCKSFEERKSNFLNIKQIKEEVMRKALEIDIHERIIKFAIDNLWKILEDIENSHQQSFC